MTDAAPATVPVVRESTEPGAISAEPPSGRETDPDDDAAHGAPQIRAAMPVVRESTDPSAVSVQPPSGRETADEVLANPETAKERICAKSSAGAARAELDVKNPAAARRRNSPLQFSALRPRA